MCCAYSQHHYRTVSTSAFPNALPTTQMATERPPSPQHVLADTFLHTDKGCRVAPSSSRPWWPFYQDITQPGSLQQGSPTPQAVSGCSARAEAPQPPAASCDARPGASRALQPSRPHCLRWEPRVGPELNTAPQPSRQDRPHAPHAAPGASAPAGAFSYQPSRTRLIASHPSPLSGAHKAERIYPPRSAAKKTRPGHRPPRAAPSSGCSRSTGARERSAQRSPWFRTTLSQEIFRCSTDGAEPPPSLPAPGAPRRALEVTTASSRSSTWGRKAERGPDRDKKNQKPRPELLLWKGDKTQRQATPTAQRTRSGPVERRRTTTRRCTLRPRTHGRGPSSSRGDRKAAGDPSPAHRRAHRPLFSLPAEEPSRAPKVMQELSAQRTRTPATAGLRAAHPREPQH